jgi:outer membrane protein OmpA-like peptidoglycan-associated protein
MRALPLVLVAAGAGAAHAQDVPTDHDFPVDRLHLDADGLAGIGAGRVPRHLGVELGLWLGATDDPLVVHDNTSGERVASLVGTRVAGALVASIGLADRYALGIELPLVLHQDGDEMAIGAPASLAGFGAGDLRLVPKMALLRRDIDLAFALALSLPTASSTSYLGEAGVTVAPTLLLTRTFSRFRVGGSLAYLARPRSELLDLIVDDEILVKLGAGVSPLSRLWLDVSLSAGTAAREPFADPNVDPAELLAVLTFTADENISVFAGGGFGVNPGFGTPDWRALVGLRFRPGPRPVVVASEPPPIDADGDRVADGIDRCPDQAETWNQHLDDDGCADRLPDGDQDGLAGPADRCADVAEDLDGFLDDDGCPDPDNDGDGLLDADDRCPLEAGSLEARGCPDADRDGDGVVDRLDNCPDEAGDQQGCKDKQRVALTAGKIEILESVFFATNQATIQRRSYPLLDDVARVMLAHPELGQIIVEGHTDDVGSDARNLALSQKRAEAVKAYLVKRGVPGERLDPFGFGESRPLVPNEDADSRARTRRVVFVIAEP